MRNRCIGGWLLAMGLMLCACEDHQQALPAYRQDLAELTTDLTGRAYRLSLDDGSVRKIQNTVSGLVPDTVYRILALYLDAEEGKTVTLQGANTVFSPLPVEEDQLEDMKTDPLEVKSLWPCKRYINLLVGIKTGGGQHALGFIDHGLDTTATGTHKLKLELFHDQKGDTQFYTQNAYLSCPIYPYAGSLVEGQDSVELKVNTFKGVITRRFLY